MMTTPTESPLATTPSERRGEETVDCPLPLEFWKMQGLGNDFVVVDAVRQQCARDVLHLTTPSSKAEGPSGETTGPLTPSGSAEVVKALADRRRAIGFDQLLVVQPPEPEFAGRADFCYRIFNADGSEVHHCGNGARCVAVFVREYGLWNKDTVRVHTLAGTILPLHILGSTPEHAQHPPQGTAAQHTRAEGLPHMQQSWRVQVDMGLPCCTGEGVLGSKTTSPPTAGIYRSLPDCTLEIAKNRHTPQQEPPSFTGALTSEQCGQRSVPVTFVDVGNPHAVVFLDDATDLHALDIRTIGTALQRMRACFPNSVNVEFVRVIDERHVRLRIFERGAGETLACGTGACAAVVAAVRLGRVLPGTSVLAEMKGGELHVQWSGNDGDSMTMTGPACFCFAGKVSL